MAIASFGKDPDAVLDYKFDWGAWLDDGETISSATVTVESGLTEDSTSDDGTSVTVWLSGGSAGTYYEVTCQVTTTAGRTDDRTIEIRVKER